MFCSNVEHILKRSINKYFQLIDLFFRSLGVTTYVLLSGYSPFGGDTDQETFCNISRAEIDFPDDLFKGVSNEAIDFMKSLLLKNPK